MLEKRAQECFGGGGGGQLLCSGASVCKGGGMLWCRRGGFGFGKMKSSSGPQSNSAAARRSYQHHLTELSQKSAVLQHCPVSLISVGAGQ